MKKKAHFFSPSSWDIQILVLSFILGIITCFIFHISWIYWIGGSIFIVITLLFLLRFPARKIFFFLLCFAFILGGIRVLFHTTALEHFLLPQYKEHEVVIFALIDQPPLISNKETQFILAVDSFTVLSENNNESSLHLESGREKPEFKNFSTKEFLLLHTTSSQKFSYGNRIEVRGVLKSIKETNPDLENFFLKDSIVMEMQSENIKLLENKGGNFIFAFSYKIRDFLEMKIQSLFPEPAASLLGGLLLGLRKSIPFEVKQNLSITGLTHIIAISGFNITIIITFCAGFLLQRASRAVRTLGAGLMIVLFIFVVGPSASVVRAGIMGLIGLLALLFGRKGEALHTLMLALFFMSCANPFSLLFDIGFQLSFLATLGLILLTPIFEDWFSHIPSLGFIKETMIATLAAQLIVLPLILQYFQNFSLIAPFSNLIIVPLIPFTMLFGFLALFLSLFPFVNILAPFIGIFGYWLLSFIVWVIDLLAHVPFASYTITWWNIYFTLLSYVAIGWLMYRKNNIYKIQ